MDGNKIRPVALHKDDSGCVWHSFPNSFESCFGRSYAKHHPKTASVKKRQENLLTGAIWGRRSQKSSLRPLRPPLRHVLSSAAPGGVHQETRPRRGCGGGRRVCVEELNGGISAELDGVDEVVEEGTAESWRRVPRWRNPAAAARPGEEDRRRRKCSTAARGGGSARRRPAKEDVLDGGRRWRCARRGPRRMCSTAACRTAEEVPSGGCTAGGGCEGAGRRRARLEASRQDRLRWGSRLEAGEMSG
ncbi:hypothetical protein PAHAL_3G264700 [Panicum hallii]|uniref:Uncharacterized protein n=1 Tax=Panicum hallii TaxID=206008 RepID=A0A2T8KJM6_9POAL|nr:hypothetical protein PAHAL_3G264700 [Panicum hallii]